MKTYQAVKAAIARLEKKAEAMRRNELKSVIAQVKKTIAEYGLTAAELGLGRGAPKAAARRVPAGQRAAAGVARYRNPKTGETWTGRGRPPAWIAGAKDREAFLIAAAAAAPPAPAKAPARKARAAAKPAGKAAKAAGKTAKAAAGRKKAAAKGRKPRAAEKTAAVQIESGVAAQ